VVCRLCSFNEIDKENYDPIRPFFARVLRYDIYILELGFHSVAVVLTFLHKGQEQQYAQGEIVQITEHKSSKQDI
jgi:hypothetical protein